MNARHLVTVFCALLLWNPLFAQEKTDSIEQVRKLLSVREFRKAETLAREAATAAPTDVEARVVLGWSLVGQDKFKDAEQEARAALEAAPEDFEANCLLGLSLLGQDKPKEAEQALLKAEQSVPEIDPKDPDEAKRLRVSAVHVGLGRLHMAQKQIEKSADALSRAEKIQPKNPEIYYHRGMLGATRKDYAAAARDMDKAIELNPKWAEPYYYAGIAYNQIKRPDKMVERFQAFLKLAPDAPEAAKVRTLLRSIR